MPVTIGEVEGPFGPVLVARTERGVAAIRAPAELPELLDALRRRFPHDEPEWGPGEPLPGTGTSSEHEMPIDLRGLPDFDARVYREVHAIPAGETLTYGEVAARIGSPGAARAVGGAMARCPLFPLVPCHRVVRAADGWSGWGGDPAVKRRLLRAEAR